MRLDLLRSFELREIDSERTVGIRRAMLELDDDTWQKIDDLISQRLIQLRKPSKFSGSHRVAMLRLNAIYPTESVFALYDIPNREFSRMLSDCTAAFTCVLGEENGYLSKNALDRKELRCLSEYQGIQNNHIKVGNILNDDRFEDVFNKAPVMRMMINRLHKDYTIYPLLDELDISVLRNINSRFRNFIINGNDANGTVNLMRKITYKMWLAGDSKLNANGVDIGDLINKTSRACHYSYDTLSRRKKTLLGKASRFIDYLNFYEGHESVDNLTEFVANISDGQRRKAIVSIAENLKVSWPSSRGLYGVGRLLTDFVLTQESNNFSQEDILEAIDKGGIFLNAYKDYRDIIRSSDETIQSQERNERGRAGGTIFAKEGF